jgi:hypothetical protein
LRCAQQTPTETEYILVVLVFFFKLLRPPVDYTGRNGWAFHPSILTSRVFTSRAAAGTLLPCGGGGGVLQENFFAAKKETTAFTAQAKTEAAIDDLGAYLKLPVKFPLAAGNHYLFLLLCFALQFWGVWFAPLASFDVSLLALARRSDWWPRLPG